MKIIKISYNNVYKDKKLVSKLKKLTLDDISMMQLEMVRLDALAQDKKEINGFVYLAKKNNIICGWALIHFETNYLKKSKNKGLFQVFIKEKYRRQGIGSMLFLKAEKYAFKNNKKLWVSPWDDISSTFYKNLNSSITHNVYQAEDK